MELYEKILKNVEQSENLKNEIKCASEKLCELELIIKVSKEKLAALESEKCHNQHKWGTQSCKLRDMSKYTSNEIELAKQVKHLTEELERYKAGTIIANLKFYAP